MASKDEYKLKFVIDADGTTASQALKSVTGEVNKFGGVLTSTFGGFVPVLGAVEAGFLAVTAGIVSAGTALFKLAQHAEEYGSTIYDASVKTGLHADALSAMRLAGEQSETSFEQITKGIGKFTLTVSQANDKLPAATEAMKKFGLDPKKAINDLDGSLGKVFAKIQATENPFQRAGLAAAAFGAKMGRELLPFIDQFNGNLPELIEHAKRMGAVIGDDDAAAADKFGDTMKDLDAQLGAVGRTIGQAVIPEFTEMAEYISQWLADNQGQVKSWGLTTKYALDGVIGYWQDLIKAVKSYQTEAGIAGAGGIPAAQGMSYQYDPKSKFNLFGALIDRGKAYDAAQPLKGSLRGFLGPSILRPTPDEPGDGKIKKPGKESDAAFRQFFNDLGFNVVRTYGGAINSGSPHPYGGAADVSVRGKSADDVFRLIVQSLEKGYRVVDERIPVPGIKQTGPHVHVENAKTTLTKASILGSLGFSPDELAYLKNLDAERLGKATGKGGLDAYNKKQSDEAKRLKDEEVKNFEDGERRKLEIGQSVSQSLIELQQQEYESALKFGSSPEAYAAASKLHDLKMSQIDDEIKGIEDRAARTEAGSEEEKRLVDEVTLKKIERDRIERQSLDDLDKRRQEIFQREMDRDLQRLQKEQDIQKSLEEQTRQRMIQAGMVPGYDKNGNPTATAPGQGRQGPLTDQIDALLGRMGAVVGMQNVLRNFGIIGVQAFESLGNAVGGAIEQWALYGGSIGQALKKALAAELAHVAGVATVNALYATALGFMRLAEWDFVGAGHAFVSAGLWAALAAGSAVGARALSPKTAATGSSAIGSSSASSPAADNSPYSRVSSTAYYSGRDNGVAQLAAEVRQLHTKIGSMTPGDVLTAGSRQKRGFIGETVANEMKSNPQITRNMLSTAGFNTR